MGYLIDMWFLKINTKYQRTITNKWFWMFFAVVVFASFTAYAFYCTRRGYSFSGRVNRV